jgi:hypothetical protein
MKFSTKIILGFVALAILSIIYNLDNYMTKKSDSRKEEMSKALFFQKDKVVRFSIQNKNGTFVFQREKGSSVWNMLEPQKLSADQNTLNNTIARLALINVENEIPQSEEKVKSGGKDLAAFGLDQPRVAMIVTLENGDTQTLKIGNSIEIGGKVNGIVNGISTYALNLNRSKVFAIGSEFVSDFENKSFADFRTKRVGEFSKENISKIVIRSDAVNVTAENKENKWTLISPSGFATDEDFISSFIQTYQSLLADKVIEKEAVLKDGLLKYDLLKPAAHVDFLNAKGSIVQSFDLGITKNFVFITMKDGSVAELSLSMWPEVIPLEKRFKNKLVLQGVKFDNVSAFQSATKSFFIKKDLSWIKKANLNDNLTSEDKPFPPALSFISNFEYMTGDDVIVNTAPANLKIFGIDEHSKKLTLYFQNKEKPIDIFVGKKVPMNKKSVYVKRSDSNYIFIVQDDWVQKMDELAK